MTNLPKDPPSREITPESVYNGRREFLKNAGLMVGTAAAFGAGLHYITNRHHSGGYEAGQLDALTAKSISTAPTPYDTTEPMNTCKQITSFNNYWELGVEKSDPAVNGMSLVTRPWTVAVTGEVEKELRLDIDDILKTADMQQRIYRMRCVETWSMVIPWLGFPLGDFIKKTCKPTSKAKYVAFTSLQDPERLPGQKGKSLPWPYVEGLELKEALHPLTMLATGLYGKALPSQNGAPLRLIVPWKYGFKGIKSIVEIRFTETQPPTTWNLANPPAYGFYANVNPAVSRPGSQAMEYRLPSTVADTKTQLFNGYGEFVAELYKDMDLTKNY